MWEFECDFAYDDATLEDAFERVNLQAREAGHVIAFTKVKDAVAHGFPVVRATSSSLRALIWYVLTCYESGDEESDFELVKSIREAPARVRDLEKNLLFSLDGGRTYQVAALTGPYYGAIPVYASAERGDDAPTVRINAGDELEVVFLP